MYLPRHYFLFNRSDMVKEMYATREEVTYMVTSLQQKEDTLKKVEAGNVPDIPEIPHKPVDTTDPEVVTVQVGITNVDASFIISFQSTLSYSCPAFMAIWAVMTKIFKRLPLYNDENKGQCQLLNLFTAVYSATLKIILNMLYRF